MKPDSFEIDWELFLNPRYGQFIYYSNDEIRELFHVSENTVTKARKELIAAGLIEVVRNGMIGYKIYLTPVSIAGMFD